MGVVSTNGCDTFGEHFGCAHHDVGDVDGLVDSKNMAAFVGVVCMDAEFVCRAVAGLGCGIGVCLAGWLGIACSTDGGDAGDLAVVVSAGGGELRGAGVVFCSLGCVVV